MTFTARESKYSILILKLDDLEYGDHVVQGTIVTLGKYAPVSYHGLLLFLILI